MTEIDHIEIIPDTLGWSVRIYTDGINFEKFGIGDAIQFQQETERTLGKWLADGPDDFHNPTAADLIGADIAGVLADAADVARDIERGK